MSAANRQAASPPPARNPGRPYRVCLVCLGNICRSPMAETVLRAEIERAGLGHLVEVDSAGTGDWHLGEEMDPRARAELTRRGYPRSAHRARQIAPHWLGQRDLILAMDRQNLRALRRMSAGGPELSGRVRLLRSFDPAAPEGAEVGDPYADSASAFTDVLDLIEAAAKGLAARLADILT